MKDLARELVATLEPSEGWWRQGTQKSLIDAAKTLLKVMNTDAVTDVLETVIGAIRGEYE